MRWDLAPEQDMFRDSFAEWLADRAGPEAVRGWLDAGDATPFDQRLAADGWLGVGFSEEVGGQGGGLLELTLAAEQLGYTAAPGGSWLASVLAAPALAGRPDVSAAVLERGEAAALMVPASQPPGQPGPVVVKDGGLHGTVRSVLGAGQARHLVVPVWADGECTLYLAAAGEPAIYRAGRKLLDRSRSAADITFTGAPAEPLDADGRAVLADAALRAAVLVAADSLGAADRMLRLAVDYSKQRTQFGAPIGSFQAVKHTAAMMLVAVESSRSISYYAAASVDQGGGDRALHAAAAKAQVTAAAAQAADSALTLHGAIGYTWEHDLQLFYKRAKLNEYLFGTPRVWNERLAAGLPLVRSH
ncbi:MAG TPA: acyl-CoA dehydrogenase family protein [Streptosporangiaceae bacterium]|nr:acyl-CoA dehydrogenase family protein [Streptosporangiaceae bacterium]